MMSTWKIVCIVLLFAMLITSDIICIVHFVNKKEAYKSSLVADWSADKKAQIQLIYYYLKDPEIFEEQIKELTPEDLRYYIENEVVLKKVEDSLANDLLEIFILILLGILIGLFIFIGIISDF